MAVKSQTVFFMAKLQSQHLTHKIAR